MLASYLVFIMLAIIILMLAEVVVRSTRENLETDLVAIAKRKNLNADVFSSCDINLDDDFSSHVTWAFKHIYSIPYPRESQEDESIARYYHGIQHVSRAASYIPILANLYRRHQDAEALKLTAADIKLLQLAVLFHDAAREGENVDYWDHESAILLYYYLTKTLKIPADKAKLFAEAVANKDASAEQHYNELVEEDGKLIWKKSAPREKNIYQKLVHDADCADVVRARNHFDANHLDFFNEIAKCSEQAFDEMALFILEVRSLVEMHGDSYKRNDTDIKKKYEHESAYQAVVASIHHERYRLLPRLYADGRLLSEDELRIPLLDDTHYDPDKAELDAENLWAAMNAGLVLARSIASPVALDKKHEIPLGSNEIYKTQRTLSKKTRTKKTGKHGGKQGNQNRSTSLITPGAITYASQGFFILNFDLERISKVALTDIDTGRGKKQHLKNNAVKLSPDEIKQQLLALQRNQKMGGSSRQDRVDSNYVDKHSEILFNVTQFDAIFYTQDPVVFNYINHRRYDAFHRHAPELQAITLQESHYRRTQKKLPIFEYSGMHNYLKPVPDHSDDRKLEMWVEMCSDFIKVQLAGGCYPEDIMDMPMDMLKIMSMYGDTGNVLVKMNAPADIRYPQELREKITNAIAAERLNLIKNYSENLARTLQEKPLSFLRSNVFPYLLYSPTLFITYKESIRAELKSRLEGISIFDMKSLTISFSKDVPDDVSTREYYSSEIMQIYALAILIDDREIIDTLAKKAAQQFHQQSSDLIREEDIDNRIYIYEILLLTLVFGFHHTVTQRNEELITAKLERINDFQEFYDVVVNICKYGLLTASLTRTIMSNVWPFGDKNKQIIHDHIKEYLRLCQGSRQETITLHKSNLLNAANAFNKRDNQRHSSEKEKRQSTKREQLDGFFSQDLHEQKRSLLASLMKSSHDDERRPISVAKLMTIANNFYRIGDNESMKQGIALYEVMYKQLIAGEKDIKITVILAREYECDTENKQSALKLYQLAADHGDLHSLVKLAKWYEENNGGVEENANKAVEYYQLAAAQGSAYAQLKLAQWSVEGHLMPKDMQKAAAFYQLAADQGSISAVLTLANWYEKGKDGIPQDEEKAAKFYQYAMAKHEPTSVYKLARMYEDGRGVKQDEERALELYENISRSFPEARYRQGWIYENAQCITRDLQSAKHAYMMAANFGHEEAKVRLDIVNKKIEEEAAALITQTTDSAPAQIKETTNGTHTPSRIKRLTFFHEKAVQEISRVKPPEKKMITPGASGSKTKG